MTHCESVITDANNLYSGYLKAVNTSKWKPSTQHFMFDYLTELFSIQDDLRNRTLVNGPTQEFELHERGKIRPITWMGNYYKCLSRQQREGIVELYETLFHKKVYVKNKKLIIVSV